MSRQGLASGMKAAMTTINECLSALNVCLKNATPVNKSQLAQAAESLRFLRENAANPTTALNIEKAASTLCGLLVELKCYSLALKELMTHSLVLLEMSGLSNPTLDKGDPATYLNVSACSSLSQDLIAHTTTCQLLLLSVLLRHTDGKTDWRILGKSLYLNSLSVNHPLIWADLVKPPFTSKTYSQLNNLFSLILKQTTGIDSSTSTSAFDPNYLFFLRIFAFKCVIKTNSLATLSNSKQDIDKREAFWDQLKRIIALHSRSITTLNKKSEDPSVDVMKELDDLIDQVKHKFPKMVENSNTFRQVLDEKARCSRTIATVSTLQDSQNEITVKVKEMTLQDRKESTLRSIARDLDNWRRSKADTSLCGLVTEARGLLKTTLAFDAELEMVRTACWRIFKSDSIPSEGKMPLLSYLDEWAQKIETFSEMESATESPAWREAEAGAVDTLLYLAKSAVDTAAHTYSSSSDTAFQYLQRARRLVMSNGDRYKSLTYARHVSSAYTSLGGIVAKQVSDGVKPEVYSIKFMRASAEIGKDALAQFPAEEGSIDLKNNMPGRWGNLAVAHQALGQNHEAFRAFKESILASIATDIDLSSIATVRRLELSHTALFKCINRYTRIGILDLLLPPSEASLLNAATTMQVPLELIGILLETQLAALDKSSHKQETVAFIEYNLNQLKRIYTPQTPIKRARTVLRELSLSKTKPSGDQTEATTLFNDILTLLKASEPPTEHHLKSFCSVLAASAHIEYICILYQQPVVDYTLITDYFQHALALYHQHASNIPVNSDCTQKPQNVVSGRHSDTNHYKTPKRMKPGSVDLDVQSVPFAPVPLNAHEESALAIHGMQTACHLLAILADDQTRLNYLMVLSHISKSVNYIDIALWASTELANAYSESDRVKEANASFAWCERLISQSSTSAAAAFWIHRARSLSRFAERAQSISAFENGHRCYLDGQNTSSRSTQLYLLSLAAFTYAKMQIAQGEPQHSISYGVHAMRLGFTILQCVNPEADPDPFEANASSKRLQLGRSISENPLKMARLLLMILEFLACFHEARGCPKPSLFYSQSLLDISSVLAAPIWQGQAHRLIARLHLRSGDVALCRENLHAAMALAGEGSLADIYNRQIALLADHFDKLDVQSLRERLVPDLQICLDRLKNSEQIYRYNSYLRNASEEPHKQKILQDRRSPPQKVPKGTKASSLIKTKTFLPLKANFFSDPCCFTTKLQVKIDLARCALQCGHSPDLAIPNDCILQPTDAVELCYLNGKHELLLFLTDTRKDLVLSFIQDSALSVPAPFTAHKCSALLRLEAIENHFVKGLQHASVATPSLLRQLCIGLADVRFYQSALGKSRSALGIVLLLDLACGATRRNEMIDRLFHQDFELSHWPQTYSSDPFDNSMSRYWNALRARYAGTAAAEMPANFSPEWKVQHLLLTEESIYMTTYASSECVAMRLPFARHETDEGPQLFSSSGAQEEMEELVVACRVTCTNAKNVRTEDQRTAWWQERRVIDARFQQLSASLDQWLGFAKMLCAQVAEANPTSKLTAKINKILSRALTINRSELKLHPSILVLLLGGRACETSDDDLEDLVHYLMSSANLAGIAIERDEVDMDQIVCDLREAFQGAVRATSHKHAHVFLVLDQYAQAFPWESITTFKQSSISRIPCLDYLLDRIELKREYSSAASTGRPELCISEKSAWYLVNPSGDLSRTESVFKPVLAARKDWTGISGRPPTQMEFEQALQTKDLLFYFGHGGGEQFISSQRIRHSQRCAVTLLWGCSSGSLKRQGEFDASGTPWNYMIGGCPTLVANLWDVTDKDIDRFTLATFDRILDNDLDKRRNVPQAIAEARNSCTLKFANGAAPVVFGIPAYLA